MPIKKTLDLMPPVPGPSGTSGLSGFSGYSGYSGYSGQDGQTQDITWLSGYVDEVSGMAASGLTDLSGYINAVSGIVPPAYDDTAIWEYASGTSGTLGGVSGTVDQLVSGYSGLVDLVNSGIIYTSGAYDLISGLSDTLGSVITDYGNLSGYTVSVSGVANSALVNALGAYSKATSGWTYASGVSGLAASGFNLASSGWTYASGISGYASGLSGLISGLTAGSFTLNQATPQTIVSGTPVFQNGLNVGTVGSGSNVIIYGTTGPELLPAFNDASWNYQTAWSQANGVITKVSGAGITYNYSVTPVISGTYRIQINVPTWTGTGLLAVNFGSTLNGTNNGYISGSGNWTFYQTAGGATSFQLVPTINNVQCTIDSISLKRMTDGTGDLRVGGDLIVGSAIRSMTGSDAIYLGSQGYVGIGRPEPVYLLDVNGPIRGGTQFLANSTGTNTIMFDVGAYYGTNIQLTSGYGLVFNSATAVSSTYDTGLYRVGAGILAIGNGTAGNTTGTLQVGTISGAGVINFGKYYVSGASGWTGTYNASGGQVVTVLNGIITGVA